MVKCVRRLMVRRWWVVLAALAVAACGGSGGDAGPLPEPGMVELTVNVTGDASAPPAGPGRVTSNPAGLDCQVNSCTAGFQAGSTVTLTATANAGQRFAGWSGACSGSTATCTVTMSAARSVGAQFATLPDTTPQTLSVAVTGGGSVASQPAGIACGSTCSAGFARDGVVTLTATPAAGQALQAWGGACAGSTGPSCTLTMSQARSATATFAATAPARFTLSLAVSGGGNVGSQPAGIACGSTCSAEFDSGTSVLLTATPAAGQQFQAWGGACTGASASCTVAMTEARNVTAAFVPIPVPAPAWGTATLLENNNDFNVAGTNTFADANVLSAIDPAGNALVLWEQSDGVPDGQTLKVYSRRFVAGQGWAPATVVPGLAAVSGRLLMDANGNATWVRFDGAARRYSPAGGWSGSDIVPAAWGGGLVHADIDRDGQVHLLGYGGGELRHSRLPAGATSWTAWAVVRDVNLPTDHGAQLAVGPQGHVFASWHERNPGDGNDSMWATRLVGGTWQAPVRIEELLADVRGSTRLAVDAAGNALAAWHQGNSVYTSRFDAATGTWGSPAEHDAGQVSGTFNANLEIAMAADGRAVLVWSSGLFALKSMQFSPGAGFTTPVPATDYTSHHVLALDRDQGVVLLYRSVDQWPNPISANQNVYARELPWGGTWRNPVLLETGAGDVKDNVPCAANPGGQVVCAWAQNDLASDNVRNSLWANLRR